MASNILSRLLPSVSEGQPEGEGLTRADIPPSDASASDGEHLEHAIDEENLGEHFQDQDLEQLLKDAAHSEIASESTVALQEDNVPVATRSSAGTRSTRPRWMQNQPPAPSDMDEDDDVPESLLLDPGTQSSKRSKERSRRKSRGAQLEELPPPVPGPATRNTRAQWRATKAQQPLHGDDEDGGVPMPKHDHAMNSMTNALLLADPKDKAMWKWANVQNLDKFLLEVYAYYEQKGFWSILLRKAIGLMSVAFVVAFTTFLTMCVTYSDLPKSTKLSDIMVPQCTKKMSTLWNVLLWFFVVFWIYSFIQAVVKLPQLWEMHNFYHYLLGIPDSDIQTVSWQFIVQKMMALRDANATTALKITAANRRFITSQSKQRMDAHDIANRLMRQDNYLIALVNKGYLDLTVPIPFLGNTQFWTRNIEWFIWLCLMDFVFDEDGQIKPQFLTSTHRRELIDKLRHRFAAAAFISILWSPFYFGYYLLSYFFQYFTEYRNNPSELGSRTFTPLAEWKFREFNELWHLFERRKNMAYPYATKYLEQFPKDKMAQFFKFVSFVTGALAAVLGIASLLDPELFLGFEVTPGKTVLFYLGVLSAIYAFARGQVPEDDLVLDPEFVLNSVIECTHYCPQTWEGRLHSDEVRKEFSALYKPKVVVFLEEALSMIVTPYVLLFSLPRCADRLIDFFREFTVHVDGVGHVCSFAVFDFTRPGKNNGQKQPGQDLNNLRQDHFADRENKMYASYLGFMEQYGNYHGHKGSKSTHQNFHLPPVWPNMLSPKGTNVMDFAGNQNPRQSMMAYGAGGGRQSVHSRTPAFGAQNHPSPMHSILLDPHNQPSPVVHRMHSSPRQGPHAGGARYRSRQPVAHPSTTSRIIEEDSMLGDSWRTNNAADDDEEMGDGAKRGEDPGVLGLLRGFQKAHAEGRGVGI
ncbi:membrane protein Gsa14p [Rhizodiscina lignyota]|uniref:Autophagy-related protein 9 n=1 Tax=Rhizodiscina lignyota TaxID=1504668 RepID=A0A9P4IKR4_9PEZI|nr:membrane protein Gsa14p [Rhizodiscina lignyota]